MIFSTYFGGTQSDGGTAVALDSMGRALLAGTTQSTDFPTTNPFQASNAGILDSFVALFADYVPHQPVAESASPASGSGSSQTFQFTYRDANGYEEMAWVFALFHTQLTQAGGCYIQYNHAQNTLRLMDDAASAWLGPVNIGSPVVLQNGQCISVSQPATRVAGARGGCLVF